MSKKIYITLLSLALILSVGSATVYALTEVFTVNHFSTGVVDIELDEYSRDMSGKEMLWEDISDILPGEKISKIPRITNEGNDSYVRAKIDFSASPISINNIYGMPEQWVLANDGYYYYRDILSTGESVDLFEGIHVPTDMKDAIADTSFQIKIDVEAVQSQNFTPDYTKREPWGDVEILACVKEGQYNISTFKKSGNAVFEIKYEGETGDLVANENDFFKNFPIMLPGDVYKDTLYFSNDSDDDIKLYFRTSAPHRSDLMNQMTLRITKRVGSLSEVVYEGDLKAEELNENILLAELNRGEDGALTYEVSVPPELNNEYTLLEDYVIWVFSTKPILNTSITPVPTGDDSLDFALGLNIVGMILGILALLVRKYVKEREVNEI